MKSKVFTQTNGPTGPAPSRPGADPNSLRMTGFGGRLLAKAFDSITLLPVNGESRTRLRRTADAARELDSAEAVTALAAVVESDPILAAMVMREASALQPCDSVPSAVKVLGAVGMRELVGELDAYDALEPGAPEVVRQERFRIHAVATAAMVVPVAEAAGLAHMTDELVAVALLHDIGRLVIVELHGEAYGPAWPGETPEERLLRERRELGIDHAMVGGVLVRRWGVERDISNAIERHHSADGGQMAAVVRLADAIVHRVEGSPISGEDLKSMAEQCDIDEATLRGLLYEAAGSASVNRKAPVEPCPLSPRELDALLQLSTGKVYKQIATELGLSVSTVRTHLHNIYRKLGAADRAQAVLIAKDKGWI